MMAGGTMECKPGDCSRRRERIAEAEWNRPGDPGSSRQAIRLAVLLVCVWWIKLLKSV
jgi:hypothetical protein